jgi:hypothetical protein
MILPQNEVLKLKGRHPCEATCLHFRCGQRALNVRSKNPQNPVGYRSNPWEQRTVQEGSAFCNWVGDVCVSAKCNYAFCEKRALLTDGSCGLVDRETSATARSIEEEARREEAILRAAQERLLKKTGRNFIE